MSFTRANPGGWNLGDKVTSTQLNAIDTNVSTALDKRSGQVEQLQSKIQTTSGGRLELNDNDYVLLNAAHSGRSRSVVIPPLVIAVSTGWTYNVAIGGCLQSTANAGNAQNIPIPALHNGATLSSVTAYVLISSSHTAGGVPATLPRVQVNRYTVTGNGAASALYAGGADFWSPAPASGVAWYNSGNAQSFSVPCTVNNVIDTSQYVYSITIIDENGANSLTGNLYFAFKLNYTNIVDMRFA